MSESTAARPKYKSSSAGAFLHQRKKYNSAQALGGQNFKIN
jgi:hypothetical protein